MRRSGFPISPAAPAIVVLTLVMGAGAASAEDLKGKFYIGGGLGVLVTDDNIRNNAALIIAPLGDDGAPFTGDKGEEVSCDTASTSVYCDPRPDDLIARESQIQTSYVADFRVGYGLTSALSLEFSAGWFEGDINNMDVYTTKRVPVTSNPTDPCLTAGVDVDGDGNADPCNLTNLKDIDYKSPISAGTITQIPLELNALVRFRKDSNFNPYVGGGIGYLITELDVSQDVDDLNQRMQALHLTSTSDEFGPSFGQVFSFDADGNAEFNLPAEVTVEDGFQWQFLGGLDYFFNDRISMHFEAKYILAKTTPWADEEDSHRVRISLGGEDQVNLEGFPEDMFRKDGTVKIFMRTNDPPNPLDLVTDPSGNTRFTCDFNRNGVIDANDLNGKDYDGNGSRDQCFNPASGTTGEVGQTVVVQGGTIELTNYTFGFGVKFHF
jgi:opacity protein-like surface antigen